MPLRAPSVRHRGCPRITPYDAPKWLSEIDPIIAAHQVTRGGNVIAYQVENEYAGQGDVADYNPALHVFALAVGGS